jgi:hypothetical protein
MQLSTICNAKQHYTSPFTTSAAPVANKRSKSSGTKMVAAATLCAERHAAHVEICAGKQNWEVDNGGSEGWS